MGGWHYKTYIAQVCYEDLCPKLSFAELSFCDGGHKRKDKKVIDSLNNKGPKENHRPQRSKDSTAPKQGGGEKAGSKNGGWDGKRRKEDGDNGEMGKVYQFGIGGAVLST